MKILPIFILIILVLLSMFPLILRLIFKVKKSNDSLGEPPDQTISKNYPKVEHPTNYLSKKSGISHYTGGKVDLIPLTKEKKRILLNQ